MREDMLDYGNMSATSLGQMSSSISLPPISTIDFSQSQHAHHLPPDLMHNALPMPPRTLPPLPHYSYGMQVMQMPQPEYVTSGRPFYAGTHPAYGMGSGRMPLPSTGDPNIMVAPSRQIHKTKEVKRRTKTGCMTCRKRRIKCGEERPECRNCIKSKRQCAGYDPVFQPQSSQSLQPATEHGSNPSDNHANPQSSTRHDVETSSPTTSSQYANASPQDHHDFPYGRSTEPLLPIINQGYSMDSGSLSSINHRYLCTIAGQRSREVPPLSQQLVPNFTEIRKVYDTFFGPSLDAFVESSPTRPGWYAQKGWDHLIADRLLLAQFMLYLTLVSNTPQLPSTTSCSAIASATSVSGPEQAALASQEARITWAFLNLCMKPAQEDDDEDAQQIARRVKAIEALLTGEPIVKTGSMSDFLHQDFDTDSEMGGVMMVTVPTQQEAERTVSQKQFLTRSEEFWRLVEKAAERPTDIKVEMFEQTRRLLDGMESRDLIYSMMLLGSSTPIHATIQLSTQSSQNDQRAGRNGSGSGSGSDSNHSSPSRAARRQEKEQASRLIESEASGRASNLVLTNISGMASRAFVQ